MSDTPRTNAMLSDRLYKGMLLERAIDLCREMERELKRAEETIEQLSDHSVKVNGVDEEG